jgi:hypothetical protein
MNKIQTTVDTEMNRAFNFPQTNLTDRRYCTDNRWFFSVDSVFSVANGF